MQSDDARIAFTGSALIGMAVAVVGLLTEGMLFHVGLWLILLGTAYAFVDEALTRRAKELDSDADEAAPHPDD